MRKIIILIPIITLLIFTSGVLCAQEEGEFTLPNQPQAQAQGQTAEEPGKISLDLKGMDLVEVLKMLAAKGNLNMVLGNDVKGRVTIFLKSVNLMDALDIILIANNLAYDKRGDIIYVMSQREYEMLYGEKYADRKEARIFKLKYARAAEVAKALAQIKTKIGKIVVDEGSNTIVVIDSPNIMPQITAAVENLDMHTVTKIFELRYAKAADMKTKISESLTKGIGAVQIDERTNKIVVTDLERKMEDLTDMIEAFDDRLQQVLIESKIVQITLDDKYQLGVDWDSVLKKLSKEVSIKSAFQLAAQGALTPGGQIVIGTLGVSDYAVMVQALKTIGDTNLLSSPRITALNNQEAKILIGTSQPYATNTVTQGTSTTTTGTNLSFIDIGVKLYVTPTINKDNFITMKIKPEVSSKSGDYTYGSPATTVPIVETTQAETSVMIKDGTTIIIAGLIKDNRTNATNKVPFVGDIPILGEIFKKTVKEVVKQELVIFLTPHILTGDTDYVEQPRTDPIGKEKFTMSEKPAFERRDKFPIDPNMFKKKYTPSTEEESDESVADAESKSTIERSSIASSSQEYYYNVKGKIIENIVVPKGKKYDGIKGHTRLGFFLSSNGNIASGPEILESSNHVLDEIAVKAVKKAAPFSPFPASMTQAEKRFVIDVAVE